MNEMNRDTKIARALDRLPVPEHGADFWRELDARLDAEDGIDVVSERRGLRRSARRWRQSPRGLLAVAAALVVVVGAAALTSLDRDDRNTVTAGDTDDTTQPTTTTPSTDTTLGKALGSGPATARNTPRGAVLDWLDALGRGDVRTATALVGPKSRRYIEALGGNVEGFMTESQEGYGSWADSPDRSTTEVDLGVIDRAATTIVVVSGTNTGEGSTGFRTDAVPAVQISGRWMVEPVAFRSDTGGRLEVVSPAPKSGGGLENLAPDGVISAAAPGGGDFSFSLDNSEPVRLGGERNGSGVRATWDPPGNLATETHLLVIAYADGDTLTAFAGRFAVHGV